MYVLYELVVTQLNEVLLYILIRAREYTQYAYIIAALTSKTDSTAVVLVGRRTDCQK